jgi:hypothetical protein
MDGQAAGGQLDEKAAPPAGPAIRYSGRKIKTLQADLLIGKVMARARDAGADGQGLEMAGRN